MSSALLEVSSFSLVAFASANTLLALVSLYLLLWKKSWFGINLLVVVWTLTVVVYGTATTVSANLSLIDSFFAACAILTALQALGDFAIFRDLLRRDTNSGDT